jgi:hypothetical protein
MAVAAGIAKEFNFRESVKMRFESTFTNVINRANFAAPATDVSNPSTFGVLTQVSSKALPNSSIRITGRRGVGTSDPWSRAPSPETQASAAQRTWEARTSSHSENDARRLQCTAEPKG